MGQLRDTWRRTKQWSEDVASGKIEFDFAGTDTGGTKKAIKSFTDGFGPGLDKVEKAFKAKNDADTKKYADSALKIATTYKASIEKNKAKMAASAYANFAVIIDILIKKLTELKTNGAAAKVDI